MKKIIIIIGATISLLLIIIILNGILKSKSPDQLFIEKEAVYLQRAKEISELVPSQAKDNRVLIIGINTLAVSSSNFTTLQQYYKKWFKGNLEKASKNKSIAASVPPTIDLAKLKISINFDNDLSNQLLANQQASLAYIKSARSELKKGELKTFIEEIIANQESQIQQLQTIIVK